MNSVRRNQSPTQQLAPKENLSRHGPAPVYPAIELVEENARKQARTSPVTHVTNICRPQSIGVTGASARTERDV